MNLRDPKNLDKWKLLSGVVKQTRQLDPTRPVVSSSSYARDTKFYESSMKPAGIDDGDIDDLHSYNGCTVNRILSLIRSSKGNEKQWRKEAADRAGILDRLFEHG